MKTMLVLFALAASLVSCDTLSGIKVSGTVVYQGDGYAVAISPRTDAKSGLTTLDVNLSGEVKAGRIKVYQDK